MCRVRILYKSSCAALSLPRLTPANYFLVTSRAAGAGSRFLRQDIYRPALSHFTTKIDPPLYSPDDCNYQLYCNSSVLRHTTAEERKFAFISPCSILHLHTSRAMVGFYSYNVPFLRSSLLCAICLFLFPPLSMIKEKKRQSICFSVKAHNSQMDTSQ